MVGGVLWLVSFGDPIYYRVLPLGAAQLIPVQARLCKVAMPSLTFLPACPLFEISVAPTLTHWSLHQAFVTLKL